MTNKQLIKEWIDKHEIVGNNAWWNGRTYYSLTLDQIRDIVNYVNQKSGTKEGGER